MTHPGQSMRRFSLPPFAEINEQRATGNNEKADSNGK
jgi:hypothetical protein